MSKIKGITIACMFLILSACQAGGAKDIVGRWEFSYGDSDKGAAYEFQADGTGVQIQSLDLFHPMSSDFSYTYDPESGALNLSVPGRPTNVAYQITFESNNEIIIDDGQTKPRHYFRKPLPELPSGARARLGQALLGKDFEFMDAKKLEPGWEGEFGEFTAVALTDIEMKTGEDVIKWLVTLQIEGEDGASFYVLQKGSGRWGVIQLIKKN